MPMAQTQTGFSQFCLPKLLEVSTISLSSIGMQVIKKVASEALK